MTDKPEINFNHEANDVHIGDNIGEQNNVEGDQDKSQGKIVDSVIHGDVNQTMSQNTSETYNEAITNYFEELVKRAPELVEESPKILDKSGLEIPDVVQPVTKLSVANPFTQEAMSEIGEVEFSNNEDHPKNVLQDYELYTNSSNPPTEEEQKNFFQKTYSCIKKYGSSEDAKFFADVGSGILNTAFISLPFPVNVISFILKKLGTGN